MSSRSSNISPTVSLPAPPPGTIETPRRAGRLMYVTMSLADRRKAQCFVEIAIEPDHDPPLDQAAQALDQWVVEAVDEPAGAKGNLENFPV
jgi:hypothetical protein